jgi:hypothetical protein
MLSSSFQVLKLKWVRNGLSERERLEFGREVEILI